MNGAESNKLKPALIAGLAAGAAAAIPPLSCLNLCCCALIIGGGYLAAYLYLKESPPTPEPPYGDAAVLGLLTGAIAAFACTVIAIPIQLAMSGLGFEQDFSQLEEALQDTELPPEALEWIEWIASSGGLTVGAILGTFFFYLIVYAIFALIGALIGVATLHKKQLGAGSAGGSIPPPPPPATL